MKQPPASLETLVDREVDAIDGLAAAVRRGVRGPGHYDELEERADGIGKRLRAAFRECRQSGSRR